MNNWIDISEDRLRENFLELDRSAGPATEVLAVIKANAYGHGAAHCARVLVRAGARLLGVTSAYEGRLVREALQGAPAEILIMCGFLPDDLIDIREAQLTPVVWTAEQVSWLAGMPGLKVHLEVDTGMGRQGVTPGPDLDERLAGIAAAGLVVEGVFTHFSSAEEADSPITLAQQSRFTEAMAQVENAGIRPAWVHAGSSSSLDNPVGERAWLANLAARTGARAMVRTGIALYGYCLPITGDKSPCVRGLLKPVLTWKARVLTVRSLAPGETVGYNAVFRATAPMRVALLPVGYADGLRRELSGSRTTSGGWTSIHGQRAVILGRISMNLTVVDVTHIDNVQPGDEAVVLGDRFDAEDHARLAGTIAYEILCGIHPCP